MDSLTDRFKRSLSQRGLVGTVQMCRAILLSRVSPAGRQREAEQRRVDGEFDRQHGVNTGGTFRPRPDEVSGSNWALGNHYAAVEPAAFAEALNQVRIPHAEFTFIDFGSGKGRCLLLASDYPFKRIIGVEFCPELNRIARQNVRQYLTTPRCCSQISVIDADATEFEIPAEPVVLFMNNPFAEPLMKKVVKNVADSYRRSPRQLVIIYFWPFFGGLWETCDFLKHVQATPAIFDSGPVPARARPQQTQTGLTA